MDMRISAGQRAEEMSAKTSVKMVPPLVFFYFLLDGGDFRSCNNYVNAPVTVNKIISNFSGDPHFRVSTVIAKKEKNMDTTTLVRVVGGFLLSSILESSLAPQTSVNR